MNVWNYISEISKIQFLKPEIEKQLWSDYKEHDRKEAREQLIMHYQPLVVKILMSWKMPEKWLFDTLQEGLVGLIEAVESYDHKREIAFSIFSVHRIRGRMVDFMRREGRSPICVMDQRREDGMTLVEQLPDSGLLIPEIAEDLWLGQEVQKRLQFLSSKEKQVLEGFYLQDLSPKQIASQLEVSLGYVYRLQTKGIRRIRGMFSQWVSEWNGTTKKKTKKLKKHENK